MTSSAFRSRSSIPIPTIGEHSRIGSALICLQPTNWDGCFRCHDGKHVSADGNRSIKASDCNSCHLILAQGSGEALQQINAKGHEFMHIDAPYTEFSCTDCHTGGVQK